MYISYCAFLMGLIGSFADAFFLFGEKPEPVLFCIKVCPLYCSPRRRRDVDAPWNYWDATPFLSNGHIIEDFPAISHDPYYFCKPQKKTTTTITTTMAPTTEEPSWICMVCLKKCNYPKKA